MTLVRRPSPFSELSTLRQAMDRLFDDRMFRPYEAVGESFGRLPLDVRSTGDSLVVEASLPGIGPDDVDITVENNTLTIRAELREDRPDESVDWLVREISRGSMMRSVALPTGLEADRTQATFEHGVLTLRIPRAERVKPRQIRIPPVTTGSTSASDAPAAGTASNGASAPAGA